MASLQSILGGNFNANAVEPQANRSSEPLPAGVYEAEITNAEIGELKSGKGVGLKLEFTVIGPTHARRKVWQNLNIKHENQQAEQIAQSQLSALCRVLGIGELADSDQLFQRIVRIGVKVRPAQGQYEASNDVTGYEPVGTPMPAAQPQQRIAVPAPAPAAPAKAAPWAKRAA